MEAEDGITKAKNPYSTPIKESSTKNDILAVCRKKNNRYTVLMCIMIQKKQNTLRTVAERVIVKSLNSLLI